MKKPEKEFGRKKFQSLTQDSRDFSRERNAQSYLLSDMGFKPASEIEPPAGAVVQ